MYLLKNNKNRIYNGIKPQWMISVDKQRKEFLLKNWFILLKSSEEKEKTALETPAEELEKVLWENDDKDKDEENEEPWERQELFELHKALFWKEANENIKIETLRNKIEKKEKELENQEK